MAFIRITTIMALLTVMLMGSFAHAREQINAFDVVIDVDTNGDITVTETINVTAEGNQIRRGIFRDLVRTYTRDGVRYRYDYDIISVTRDGKREPYTRETDNNALRIRIGDADVLLGKGQYTYALKYRVKNQIRYFDSYDEVYWNVTGTYWVFPIMKASALIRLPDGAKITQTAGYTGAQGATGRDFRSSSTPNGYLFETTKPLPARAGLTVAVGFEKGIIDPPSPSDKRGLWWQRNGALTVLGASLLAIFGFYWRGFNKVGRDPQKGPLIIHYEPPKDYSPAAVHHVYYRGLRGNAALISTLINLGIHGRLTISTAHKNTTTLTPTSDDGGARDAGNQKGGLCAEEENLQTALFKNRPQVILDGKTNTKFISANRKFQSEIIKRFGADYFKWNGVYAFIGIPLSIIAIIFALFQGGSWTVWHTAALLSIAAINALFLYLMPAPTKRGQKIRRHIEGFKRYLETAEKLHLNQADAGGSEGVDAPPVLTQKRYERFLPYAIALDVEKPWTQHFESRLPTEAQAYDPAWGSHSMHATGDSLNAMNAAMVAAIATGVASAMPQSSSSGSGGGGSSGGGGGGGGGGGW